MIMRAFYYHSETRRKLVDYFRGHLATLKFDSLARQLQQLYSYIFNRMFLDKQIINIIVYVYNLDCRKNECSQTPDQYFPYILRRYHVGINQDRGIAYDVYRF